MQTGDGLLVRLRPVGTIRLAMLAKLCAAARKFGNGIVEITARGNIQVRGLDAASAPLFAAAVGALGIAAEDGVAVHANPLTGLDPGEILDAGNLAADLRRALAERALGEMLAPKISVAIDGGGALNLDRLAADVRLRADLIKGAALLRISLGGDRTSATHLGLVAPADGVEVATRLLEIIARRGADARARDVLAAEGIAPFSATLADLLLTSATASGHDGVGSGREAIGLHRLRDGSLACGVGLGFGHTDARVLELLIEAAADAGANGIRPAPGRALIAIGLSDEAATAFVTDAGRLGFIVRADDPRRYLIACAGAPVCASAHIAARAMAPRVAADCARYLGGSFTIHISGCGKGCAHPMPAALTVVGLPDGCGVVADGSVKDAPFAVVATDELPAAIAGYARELTGEDGHV